MGAYVSRETCAAQYGVQVNCSIVFDKDDNSTAVRLGEYAFGEFPGDPDIAGIGVLGAFLCVTATSLLLSIASTFWWSAKNVVGFVNRLTKEEKNLKNWQLSVAGIIEALIVTCSDQQVFTGGAYAITLRYAKACSVSAYHYNIVANILLVTCATHLMAVTIARHYWQYPYVGILRIVVTTLVFVITGVLLSNQGSGSLGFPTEVPRFSDQYSPMLLPAACFQSASLQLDNEVSKALQAGSIEQFFTGQIHGWANYLIMFLFYMIAVAVSLARILRRGLGHNGRRKRFIRWLEPTLPFFFRLHVKRFFYGAFGLYLTAGIALSAWTVAIAAVYVFRLRYWVDQSGWIGRTGDRNPENDPSTFGQLVPLLLMSLTVFTFLQIISERVHARRRRAKRLAYTSLRRRSRSRCGSDSRSPSPSGTAYTAGSRYASVVKVGVGSMHEIGHMPCAHNPQQDQQLYDYPYRDNEDGKSELKSSIVGVTIVEEPGEMPEHVEHEHGDRGRARSTDGSEAGPGTGAPVRKASLFKRVMRNKGGNIGVGERRGGGTGSLGEGGRFVQDGQPVGVRGSAVSLPAGVGADAGYAAAAGYRVPWLGSRSSLPSSFAVAEAQEECDIALGAANGLDDDDPSRPMVSSGYRTLLAGTERDAEDGERLGREFGMGGSVR